jgi:hypothetical protein
VRVLNRNGEQLGFLASTLAADVVSMSEQGYRFAAIIKDVTGGGKEQSLGVNLLIIRPVPGTGDRDARKYLKRLIRTDPGLGGATVRGGCLKPFLVLGV